MSVSTVPNASGGTGAVLPETLPERVVSVDALRGLAILLMIFVNDVSGISKAPAWLKHVLADADAMTLPDVVFPAFLFVVGISIPLAFSRALARGQTRMQLFMKVLVRTFALLVMGVMMRNAAELQWGHLWGVGAYAAMFFAFAVVPRKPGRARTVLKTCRAVGIVALIGLALAYRTADGNMLILGPLFGATDGVWLRHLRWGILGEIGMAYLVVSVLYLLLGNRREWLLGAMGLLMMHYVATDAGLLSRFDTREWLAWAGPVASLAGQAIGWVGSHVNLAQSFGSLAGITMAGCCLGTILLDDPAVSGQAARLRWAAVFGLGLLAAAFLFDPLYGLNKIQATPSWCLLCAALTVWTWLLLYWVMDMRGWQSWARVLRPAGENPLLAYMLHPLIILFAGWAGLPIRFYRSDTLPVAVDIFGSLLMAFLVVGLTGQIARRGFRLKV